MNQVISFNIEKNIKTAVFDNTFDALKWDIMSPIQYKVQCNNTKASGNLISWEIQGNVLIRQI